MVSDQPHWIRILLALVFAELVFSMETSLMFAALPRAMAENDGSATVGWLVTVYFLVSGAAAAVCSVLGDKYGRKLVLMIVFAGATIGSIVSAVHSDLEWIIAGRAIQGLAGAVLPLCFGLAKEALPPEKVALGIGVIVGTGSFGASASFIVGGLLIDYSHWQSIFYLTSALSVLAIIFCGLALPKSPARHSGSLDILGGVLFVPGILAVMYAVSIAQTQGSLALTLATAGIAILIVWLVVELRHANPLIDVRLFKIKDITLANLAVMFVLMGVFYGLQIFPMLLQQPIWTGIGFGLSATATGFLKIPSALAAAAASFLAGGAAGKWGGRSMIIAGALLAIAAWIGMLFASTLWLTIAVMIVSGVSAIVVATGAVSVIVANAPSARTSEAAGMHSVLRAVAQGLGGLIVTGILASSTLSALGHKGIYPSPDSYRNAYLYIIAMTVCVLVLGLLLPSGSARRSRSGTALLATERS